jgi:hypothetical protein
MASPASAGKFFSGGEILPDGSTVLEDYVYEVISINASNTNATVTIYTDHQIPRSRTDMHNLYAFDHQRESRKDLHGTRVRQTTFYKEYLKDIEDAKGRDPEAGPWVNTFKRLSPQLDESEYEGD